MISTTTKQLLRAFSDQPKQLQSSASPSARSASTQDSVRSTIPSDVSDTSSGICSSDNIDPAQLMTLEGPTISTATNDDANHDANVDTNHDTNDDVNDDANVDTDVDTNNAHRTKEDSNSKRTLGSSSSVAFSTVEIRSFPIILGDNPACDDNGPPLAIDWQHVSSQRVRIDQYEEWRERQGGKKELRDLKIGGFFRQKLLRRSGTCTKEEIYSRMDEMERIRKTRMRSRSKYLFWLRVKSFFSSRKKTSVSRVDSGKTYSVASNDI